MRALNLQAERPVLLWRNDTVVLAPNTGYLKRGTPKVKLGWFLPR